jgi:trehalose synthase
MPRLQEVQFGPRPVELLLSLVREDQIDDTSRVVDEMRRRMEGRVLWNVNSTGLGGGVAEMLRPLLGYVKALGVDTRWVVIEGTPDFFRITKRLHHALHGSGGDGSPLGQSERAVYEQVLQANAEELLRLIRPRDFVILHDPQTAGLAPHLVRSGAIVIWRCHVGDDKLDGQAELGWGFLAPYLEDVAAAVFSRSRYIPGCCDHGRSVVIPPSIDAFSAKNQELDDATVRAILVHAGLVEGPPDEGSTTFRRDDGSPGRVQRQASVLRLGPAPSWETPLVVQISRWDPLKDPAGVMQGFAEHVDGAGPTGPALVLAGPVVGVVADDPEDTAVLEQVVAEWHRLPPSHRNRIHLASLPMADVEENAAIVNALQRHATVVVQKSLHEGFGLTVTEAMWKSRPVVASAVGGIQDQITDGVHGLLVQDPFDTRAVGTALGRILEDSDYAAWLGRNAHCRVRDEFLVVRHLIQHAELIERIDK